MKSTGREIAFSFQPRVRSETEVQKKATSRKFQEIKVNKFLTEGKRRATCINGGFGNVGAAGGERGLGCR